MAILKHTTSKNANYGDAEKYLTFEHDEFTTKPVLDADGHLIPREDYRIKTLNCGEEDFAVACMRANLRYGKNRQKQDVKSHHYIISFDPRDGPDHGLTVDRAQQLGIEFCREHFPGHQAIVCTHPDGHRHTGNIHVHIVINSLRIEDVPFLPYMDRPADRTAGMKHRCTRGAMDYFRAEVMEICEREGLYQTDLLHGSRNRVTEREYWAQRRGQAALEREPILSVVERKETVSDTNDNVVPSGKGRIGVAKMETFDGAGHGENDGASVSGTKLTGTTKFETDKEKLRQVIRSALSKAASFEEFSALLLREGVTVKESRGRLSYLTPDRTEPITARRLGDAFDKDAVLSSIEKNALRKKETAHPQKEQAVIRSQRIHTARPDIDKAKPSNRVTDPAGLQRMVDIEAKLAEGKGEGYRRWATLHNLKNAAETVAIYQEYGFQSSEDLDAALSDAQTHFEDVRSGLKETENALQEKKELRRNVLSYLGAKPTLDEWKKQKSEKTRNAFRQEHESDFLIAEAASKYLKVHGYSKLPNRKTLQEEINRLTEEKNAGYNEYYKAKDRVKELTTIRKNLDQLQREATERQQKAERDR